jgi:SatD family (SatD)
MGKSASRHDYAIVMGDLIQSEKARRPRDLHQRFNDTVNEANGTFKKAIASPLTITLGDEFQGLCNTLMDGLAIVHHMRIRLLCVGIGCRFVLGHTKLKTPLNRSKAWNMIGQGLSEARDKLNDKRDANVYRFAFSGMPVKERLMDAVGLSLTLIERDWTDTQLRYISLLDDSNESAEHLARRLKITPRSVFKVLDAADAKFHARQREALAVGAQELDHKWGLAS